MQAGAHSLLAHHHHHHYQQQNQSPAPPASCQRTPAVRPQPARGGGVKHKALRVRGLPSHTAVPGAFPGQTGLPCPGCVRAHSRDWGARERPL